MSQTSYLERRGQIEAYFDRTAADAWARLTSDAPVSGVRATVRAGREQMRCLLVNWVSGQESSVSSGSGTSRVPLAGRRLLDAGCGTGLLAVDCARLGAEVLAIDLSPTLVDLARERLPADLAPGSVELLSGDMLDPALGEFDHLVAMDSLIHYAPEQAINALLALAPRVSRSMVFTFAPGSLPLRAMIAVGRLFPRGDRSPAIVPVAPERMQRMLAQALGPLGWRLGRSERVSRGFYTSQAQELIRS
jgi:magnesium-protoporphyrin O-methyltransferase